MNSARSFGNIYLDVNQKQYISAISELAFLLDDNVIDELKYYEIYYTSLEKAKQNVVELQKIENKYKEKLTNDRLIFLTVLKNSNDPVEKNKNESLLQTKVGQNKELLKKYEPIVQAVKKYGNFMALVAKAEDSEQVSAAIEAVALPTGSASIKKKSRFNVSLNAYLGGYYGKESLDIQSSFSNQTSTYGFWAPVGIGASWGLNRAGSISAFISIIDVGAITSFRLRNPTDTIISTAFGSDTTAAIGNIEQLPEITFQNILAPGINIIYGLPWGVPISVGGGLQRGPMLRKINTVTGTIENGQISNLIKADFQTSAWRWHLFIAVDIPLLNFYTKSR